MSAVFELLSSPIAEQTDNVLGVWHTAPGEAEAVSFAAPGAEGGDAGPEVPIWRVNIPADTANANQALDRNLAHMGHTIDALPDAQARLNQLLAQAHRSTDSVSFAVGDTDTVLPPAEQQLLDMLGQIKETNEEPVSFGWFDGLKPKPPEVPKEITEAEEQFREIIARVTQAVMYFAVVETKVDSRLIGQTSLTWLGDSNTLWARRIKPDHLALHDRTLRLTIESRHALLRTFMLAAQGALKLSALLATPGGPLLALPAAWKFTNQVLGELSAYRTKQAELEAVNNSGKVA